VACPMFFKTNIATSARITEGEDAQRLKEVAAKLVDGAAVDADAVARELVSAVVRDVFYVLPMASGRWAWRLKRLAPEWAAQGGHLVRKYVFARLGKKQPGTPG